MKILVPLAEGFEEIEAITIIDILRRADMTVTTSFLDTNPVIGSHGIPVTADRRLSDLTPSDFKAIILPGGIPGSEHLKNSATVLRFLRQINAAGGLIGAICAAPIVLGHSGLLEGKKAVCYPGCENGLTGAQHIDAPVVRDGNIITARGAGCAIDFTLEIVDSLLGSELKNTLRKNLQVYWHK